MGVKVFVTQSCLTLCNPMDRGLPGFSAHGILQARKLEFIVIPFSRDWTSISCIAGEISTFWKTWEELNKWCFFIKTQQCWQHYDEGEMNLAVPPPPSFKHGTAGWPWNNTWCFLLTWLESIKILISKIWWGRGGAGCCPGGSVVKNPPANTGDTGSIPGPGRSHMLWSN